MSCDSIFLILETSYSDLILLLQHSILALELMFYIEFVFILTIMHSSSLKLFNTLLLLSSYLMIFLQGY